MFAIATGFRLIEPGLVMTANPDLAWEIFFANVKDGYSTTVRFHKDYTGRSVSYNHENKKFTFRDY